MTVNTEQTVLDAALVAVPCPIFRDQQIDYWRREARENMRLGFTDLARRCEGFASDWEWRSEP